MLVDRLLNTTSVLQVVEKGTRSAVFRVSALGTPLGAFVALGSLGVAHVVAACAFLADLGVLAGGAPGETGSALSVDEEVSALASVALVFCPAGLAASPAGVAGAVPGVVSLVALATEIVLAVCAVTVNRAAGGSEMRHERGGSLLGDWQVGLGLHVVGLVNRACNCL